MNTKPLKWQTYKVTTKVRDLISDLLETVAGSGDKGCGETGCHELSIAIGEAKSQGGEAADEVGGDGDSGG